MSNFKFNFRGRSLPLAITRRIDEVLRDRDYLEEAAKTVADDWKFTAGVGKLINSKGRRQDMPLLRDSTIDHRDYLRRAGNARSRTFEDPGFANLSMSGQLIRSIKPLKISPNKRSFVVGADDTTRRPYKGLDGRRMKSQGTTNADVLSHQIELGFFKLNVRNGIRKRLGTLLKRFLRRRLR